MKIKRMKFIFAIVALLMSSVTFVSCDDDDEMSMTVYSALVTVKTGDDGNSYFQIDKNTVAHLTNVNGKLYEGKEVRALTQFERVNTDGKSQDWQARVFWVDSILTKKAVPSVDVQTDSEYGSDPLEVTRSWTTVAEDGYITLHFFTRWGFGGKHRVTLVSGVNPENPFEFDFRHNAFGDTEGQMSYGIVAFNIKDVIAQAGEPTEVTININSYEGKKQFKLKYNPVVGEDEIDAQDLANMNVKVE